MIKIKKRRNGFTLTEVLIVTTLIAILLAVAIPVSMRLYREQALEEATSILVSHLQMAQARSMQGKGGDLWGVKIYESYYIIFRGDTCDEEEMEDTEIVYLPGGQSFTEETECIIFHKDGRAMIY